MGDGAHYLAIEVDDIKFKLFDGKYMLLKGLRHVLGLIRNLISLGSYEEGWLYPVAPDKKTLRVKHEDKTVIWLVKRSSAGAKLEIQNRGAAITSALI